MPTWLMKTEPGTYSYDDLERDGKAVWDGVSNPVALKHLRSMKKGDQVLVYHTGNEKSIIGIAEVTSGPYADPKSKDPRLVVVNLKPVRKLANPVSLAAVKAEKVFKDFELVRIPRLSVMPVPTNLWRYIMQMSR
ncbi:MAG: EVE domain-containing protein [Bacteroidota bacterium]